MKLLKTLWKAVIDFLDYRTFCVQCKKLIGEKPMSFKEYREARKIVLK